MKRVRLCTCSVENLKTGKCVECVPTCWNYPSHRHGAHYQSGHCPPGAGGMESILTCWNYPSHRHGAHYQSGHCPPGGGVCRVYSPVGVYSAVGTIKVTDMDNTTTLATVQHWGGGWRVYSPVRTIQVTDMKHTIRVTAVHYPVEPLCGVVKGQTARRRSQI